MSLSNSSSALCALRFQAGGSVSTAGWFEGRRVIDIGSGAGFPGLPLKLALPGAEVTLLESNRRKCAFLKHVVSDLQLDRRDGSQRPRGRCRARSRTP